MASLPADILLEIFGNLHLDELQRLLTVSRRWRDLVTSHPKFWLDPALYSATPSAVAFFLRRLSAAAGKPTDVTVILLEPTIVLETTVFPAIATVRDCVVTLALHVHISHAFAVFDLLRGSTRSLRTLKILFHSAEAPPSPVWLPGDLLQHCHPRGLGTVFLQNLDLPHDLPPAVSTAENFGFSQKMVASSTSLQALAASFPRVRDLTLTGRVFPSHLTLSDWPKAWQNLPSLFLTLSKRRLRKVLSVIPLENVGHLTTVSTGRVALSLILPHLHGDLHMSFQRMDDNAFAIHLVSQLTGLTRSLRERPNEWTSIDALPHGLLRKPAITERVTSMTIAVTLWDLLVPLMTGFPRLEALTIVLSPAAGHSLLLGDKDDGQCGLVCPGLRVLTLDAQDGAPAVPLDDVKWIIAHRLQVSAPVDLVLRWVNWHGSPDLRPVVNSVWGHSDPVRLYPETPWHSH